MDPGFLTGLIQLLAAQAHHLSDTLAPVGVAMAFSLTVVATALLGASFFFAPSLLLPVIEFTGWSAMTLFLCQNWGAAIDLCLNTIDQVMGILGFGGGVETLFGSVFRLIQRVNTEDLGWAATVDGTFGALARAVVLGISMPIIAVGLSLPALLAVMARSASSSAGSRRRSCCRAWPSHRCGRWRSA